MLTRKWKEVLNQHSPHKIGSVRDRIGLRSEHPVSPVPSGSDSLAAKIGNNQASDFWTNDAQCLIRGRQIPRRTLFNPYQVQGSPSLSTLTAIRATHGTYEDGTTFIKQDNWNSKFDRHLEMERPWIGRSVSIPRQNSIMHGNAKSIGCIVKISAHEDLDRKRVPQDIVASCFVSTGNSDVEMHEIAARTLGKCHISSLSGTSLIPDFSQSFSHRRALRDPCAHACAAANPMPRGYPPLSLSESTKVSVQKEPMLCCLGHVTHILLIIQSYWITAVTPVPSGSECPRVKGWTCTK